MGIVTLIGLLMVSYGVIKGIQVFSRPDLDAGKIRHQLTYIKSLGVFALVTGILGQFVGLYEAFDTIERMGEVSQPMLAGGLKVSSIVTIYGMLIFLISYIIWFVLDMRLR
jgi:predicted transcriptional regulator